ncbi:MAG: hypothetical protein HRU69_00140 [Flammeovirgaceae bacterium]|nr:MAG: hypothetical protein HRU69_00140 [Flammeovirgaceae bacterium]
MINVIVYTGFDQEKLFLDKKGIALTDQEALIAALDFMDFISALRSQHKTEQTDKAISWISLTMKQGND